MKANYDCPMLPTSVRLSGDLQRRVDECKAATGQTAGEQIRSALELWFQVQDAARVQPLTAPESDLVH